MTQWRLPSYVADMRNRTRRSTRGPRQHRPPPDQRAISEHGPDAMWVFHVEAFQLVDVNQNFVTLSGYPREKLIGSTPMDVSPPTQVDGRTTEEHARWIVGRTLQGEKVITTWTLRSTTGEDIPCELRAVHLPDPGRTLVCGSLMDVREKIKTERELAQRLLFEGLLTRLSSQMMALTFERADENINRALADIGAFAGVDRSYIFLFNDAQDRVSCTHEWCASGVSPQISRLQNLRVADFPWVEARLQRGEVVHVPRMSELPPEAHAEREEWEAEAIRSILLIPMQTGGLTRGYVGFDSVHAETVWPKESNDMLKIFGNIALNAISRVRAESTLLLRNQELARSVTELQHSNQELQQFAYVASHDLQEPLRSVSGFSELMLRRYGARLDDKGREYLTFVSSAAKRMHSLVNDLLEYSRIDARSRPFGRCDMQEILKLALTNLDASIGDSDAVVTTDVLPTVTGDPSQLTQLLQNLIGNAVKFRGAAPPRIHVGARRSDPSFWEFSISDNGIGIDADKIPKLFQIFKRLHSAEQYPGTGIGLATCKRIVERHHGGIWIEQNRDAPGSTFKFTLQALSAQ